MLYLKLISTEDADKEYDFVTGIPSEENGFTNTAFGMSRKKFLSSYLPKHIAMAEGKHLPEGIVAQLDFFLWDSDAAIIVGMFRVRPSLNDFLRNGPGHIGYAVRHEFRNKGYATKGLALALEELKKRTKDTEALLSVSKQNPASLRVMQKNGGYIHHEDETEYYVRIPLL